MSTGTATDKAVTPPAWYKEAADRCQFEKFGTAFSIADEYAALEELYDADPSHVVMPKSPVYTNDGEMEGYFMEHIDGEPLKSYLTDETDFEDLPVSQTVRQLWEVLDTVHDASVGHGDLYPRNILYEEDRGIVLIDPIGATSEFDRVDDVQADDRSNAHMIARLLAEKQDRQDGLLECSGNAGTKYAERQF